MEGQPGSNPERDEITGLLPVKGSLRAVVGSQLSFPEGLVTPLGANGHVWVAAGLSAHGEEPSWVGEGHTHMQKCHHQTL